MSKNLCTHLENINIVIKNYTIILKHYVTCKDTELLLKKFDEGFCLICKGRRSIHACLECPYFACLITSENATVSHMKSHLLKTGHVFSVHIDLGSVYCMKCDDFVYHEQLESIYNKFKGLHPTGNRVAPPVNPVKRIIPRQYIGLRGIVNIGNCCYINCVIQVLMHTPLLKEYFLENNHLCSSNTDCLACEIFLVFKEFYSENKTPYDPSERFFFKLQKFSKIKIGLEQGDSYECFQEILTGMHDCMITESQKTSEIGSCTCLIHDTFYGINRSYRECSACQTTSFLPQEYFLDIFLNQDTDRDSLPEMLHRRYLEPQLLHDFKCELCGKKETTYEFQWVKKLPKIICIRINCFICDSDDPSKNLQRKSSVFDYEHCIDMLPYFNKSKCVKLATTDATRDFSAFEHMYYLSAIIFHRGDTKGGHSVYVLHLDDNWYECDDQFVYERSRDEVIKCKPCLLFYSRMN